MSKELSKAYESRQYEDKIYQKWEESGFFNPDVCIEKGVTSKKADPFTIVLPPPNATGSLHVGHAMMLAIEDLIIRYHRMKGDKTLWIPGTDHAAIATNAIVEKQLAKEGKTKNDLGREVYVEKVKDFIRESQDNIRNQVRKMGSSLDWSREAYTWDEERNLAVRTMFKMMYDDGLIYRGYRIVNLCPHCHSTLADDEVEYKEENGKLYWIKYGPFVLATTRPETKLGDTAVAVNPKDKRYKDMVGEKYMIPGVLGKFEVVVVADDAVDPAFGSGVVKVTPAHSFTDYEIAQRHGVALKQIIDESGLMMPNCGKYTGMTTQEARTAIVAEMGKMGLIDHIEENYKHSLSVCYRCGTVIEPLPSKQWFIDVNKEFIFRQSREHPIKGFKKCQSVTLKQLMQQVVKSEQIQIIPENFYKIYFNWVDNLRDWCISRQIWVGHRIPVWYRPKVGQSGVGKEEIYVGVEAPKGEGWKQDEDNLDTWFSAGLWTFSTLGWPKKEARDLRIFHPTAVLETMFDILFFWVARMIMMTTYALGEVPFEKVYLHARVLDKDGEKMSKSKPETMIDPLDVCKKYGTDAVRLSLLLGISPGADVRLSEGKIAGLRNFTNKLWNISRFMLLNIPEPKLDIKKSKTKTLADKFILNQLDVTINEVSWSLEKYQFSGAGELLRTFTWDQLADWYLEIAKIEGDKSEILNYVLNTILKLWHPFMPFVTETIWQEVYGADNMLMVEKWPKLSGKFKIDNENFRNFNLIRDIITSIRSLRADNKIEPTRKLNAVIGAGKMKKIIADNLQVIVGLARLGEVQVEEKAKKPETAIGFVEGGVEVYVELADVVDIEKEKKRLNEEIVQIEKYIKVQEGKLGNKDFMARAPVAVVDGEKRKMEEAKTKAEKLEIQLASLK